MVLSKRKWTNSFFLSDEKNIHRCRAATNVRTFEYYSFEIFTNELFFANERSLTPVGLFLAHTLRSEASVSPRVHKNKSRQLSVVLL